MSRAKGWTGGWRVAALLAGALTQLLPGQALAQRPGISTAGYGARGGYDTRPEQKKLAVGKLLQARAYLSQGEFDQAEQAANEAVRYNVAWSSTEDSPTRLLGELQDARSNPKALLAASRAAMGRKDFLRAERYARLAEREAGFMTFTPWGDSPKKVLQEIKDAQANGPAQSTVTSTPAPTKDSSPWSKRQVKTKGDNVVQTSATSPSTPAVKADAPKAASDETDEARQVLAQARQALAKKDMDRAQSLVHVAKQMNHKLGPKDDTPEKVEADVRRAGGLSPAAPTTAKVEVAKATTPAPTPTKVEVPKATTPVVKNDKPASSSVMGIPKTKEEGRAQIALGRKQLAEGKLDEAAQTAQRVKAQGNITWGLFEDSPDRLSIEVDKARTLRDKSEADRLMVEGRRLYEKGDYDGATKAAYRAQKLHGNYSIWDLGDRPTKLLSDIQSAQARSRKPALPPTTVVKSDEKSAKTTTVVKADEKSKPASSGLLSKVTGSSQPAPAPATTSSTQVVEGPKSVLPPVPAAATTVPAERLKAQQLVAEAQRLHREDKLLEARQKAIEAQQLNVRFGQDETSPEFVYQQLAIQARQNIDTLARSAQSAVAQGNQAAATAKLEEARMLAVSFGQDARPLEAMLVATRGMGAPAAPVAPPALAQATHSQPLTQPVQQGVTQVSNPPAQPVLPAAPTGTPQGMKMLEDARAELKRGETANARRLAESALTGNHGVKDDAMALLRTIDAEEFNQKALGANRTFDAALACFRRREFTRSQAMLATVDVRLLDAERQGRLREIAMTPEMTSTARADKPNATAQGPVRTVGDVTTPPVDGLNPPPATFGPGAGRAQASDASDGGLLEKHKQMQKVLFEKLRQDGLEAQRDASEKFRAGHTDQALEVLQDYLARVQDEKLDPGQLTLLRRGVESRISQFRLMKAQKDLTAGAAASKQANTDKVAARYKAEEMKQKNVEKLMKDFNTLFKEGKYLEAESLAMRALELDPDNGVASAAVYMARRQRDVTNYDKIKSGRERLVLEGLNDAEKQPGHRAIESGVDYDEERWNQAKKRKSLDPVTIGKSSEKEKLIERQLTTPISVSFDSQPLRVVLEELRDVHGINIVPDSPALQEAGVSLESPISIKLDRVSLKSALNLILHQVRLTHAIRDEVLMITTEENAKGKLKTVSYAVADLVIPVENFADVRSGSMPGPNHPVGGVATPGTAPYTGPYAMANGQATGTPSSGSMLNGGGPGSSSQSGNGVNVTKRSANNTTEEQLIKLITSTIQPRSWSEMGGPGTLEFFPMTMSLIINQTPDIQEQIQDLLASLRRLQDQEVSVEVRFISVSEDFFERVGVNFNMNIPTPNTRNQPALQTGAFVSDSSQFINVFRPGRFLAGLTPAGSLTPTLDIPVSQNSFLQTIPQFGNYTTGGLSMGLAFLSDIQVFLFLEAAQGDQRANVMQAPKLTLFNGQTSTLNVFDQQSFVQGVQVQQVQGTGQFAVVPQNTPLPNGIFLTIQAVISADRRFVRLTMAPTLTNLLPGPVYAFPVVVPIFTSVEGFQAGQPVVFTQFIQQPIQTNISIQTTVAVPDGGTVLMGGLKKLSESRSEYGPPILSKVPYINRLFKNVGYGRETDSMLIMVTPRIIVQEEEEERQTGFRNTDIPGGTIP